MLNVIKNKKGFSLLETLVALAVLSVGLSAFIFVFSKVAYSLKVNTEKTAFFNETVELADQITSDIEQSDYISNCNSQNICELEIGADKIIWKKCDAEDQKFGAFCRYKNTQLDFRTSSNFDLKEVRFSLLDKTKSINLQIEVSNTNEKISISNFKYFTTAKLKND